MVHLVIYLLGAPLPNLLRKQPYSFLKIRDALRVGKQSCLDVYLRL